MVAKYGLKMSKLKSCKRMKYECGEIFYQISNCSNIQTERPKPSTPEP